ncbi:MAG: hypothetical protein QOD72_1240 [Acidimicrobiaceae bacterium]|jgi:hypothetical protein|nr:hypothetical protein [Acidimicrobiaceae bacterium]
MSLTETSEVFVAVEESALNDLITAVCSARPHLLNYGSPAFVPASSTSATQMAPIPFPGSPGLQWSVELAIPHLDLFKEDLPLPPELSLGPGQFSVSTVVRLCVDCADRHDGKGDDHTHTDDRGDKQWRDDRDDWGKARNPVCCKLTVFAVGHVVSTWVGGQESIGFALDSLEIVDVEPNALESVLECLLTMILRSVLATLSIPVKALELDAFSLTPTQGPLIDVNRVLARGDF